MTSYFTSKCRLLGELLLLIPTRQSSFDVLYFLIVQKYSYLFSSTFTTDQGPTRSNLLGKICRTRKHKSLQANHPVANQRTEILKAGL